MVDDQCSRIIVQLGIHKVLVLAGTLGCSSWPAHMSISNARASFSGLSFLRDIYFKSDKEINVYEH